MQHQQSHATTGVPVQVVPQVHNEHRFIGRDVTKEEKRCCCTCTRATACTFVIFMCIGGMACIAAGTAQAVLHAAKYSTVHEYNEDVRRLEAKYPSGFAAGTTEDVATITVRQPHDSLAEVTATGSEYTVRPVHPVHSYDRNDEEVTEYDAYMYSTTVPNWQATALALFTITTTNSSSRPARAESLLRGIPATKSMVAPAVCGIESCDRNCEHHAKCTTTTLQAYCERTYGSGATYHGEDSCHEDDTCGTCRYQGQLERVCVVMEEEFAMGFNHHLDSCFYPFKADSQIYGPPSQFNHSVKVEFRSAADPFITMQRLTEGKMDFDHNLREGFPGRTLIFIGLALIFVPTTVMCCYRCCCYKPDSRRHVEEGEGENQDQHQPHTTTQVVPMHTVAPAYPVAQAVPQPQPVVRPAVTINPVAAPSLAHNHHHQAADPFQDPNAIVTPHKGTGSRSFQ